jgi:hypothetical protein
MPNMSEDGRGGQLLLLSGLFQEEFGSLHSYMRFFYSMSNKHAMQNTHKAMHKTQNGIIHSSFLSGFVSNKPNIATGFYNPFPTFSYTGAIRPVYPLSPRRPVPKTIKHPDWAKTGIPKRELRLNRSIWDLLDTEGQEAMRKVCRLAREVLDITATAMKPGVTTDYLDEVCHNACVERDVSETHFSTKLNVDR